MSRLPTVANSHRKAYPSDLSDAERERIKDLLPQPKGFGHPVSADFREILNDIFYVQRTGCQWEMMPHDLPPYTTVYHYLRKWQRQGVWQQMYAQLRSSVRQRQGREADASVAILDSQSVKTTEKRGRFTAVTVAKKLKAVSGM